MTEAEKLVNEFGFRFSITTTSESRAEELRDGLKSLGLRVRVTDISGKINRIRQGYGQFKVTWWMKR